MDCHPRLGKQYPIPFYRKAHLEPTESRVMKTQIRLKLTTTSGQVVGKKEFSPELIPRTRDKLWALDLL
jgi:hypothetical protein